MKKILSAILILSVIITTFSGVLITDVSAANVNISTRTDVNFTNDSTAPDGRRIDYIFGLPTYSSTAKLTSKILVNTGAYYATGHKYDVSNVTGSTSLTATETYGPTHFADVSVINNVLDINKEMVKYDFIASTLQDESYNVQKANTNILKTAAANYARMPVLTLLQRESSNLMTNYTVTYDMSTAVSDNTKSSVYTFYAYTQNATTTNTDSDILTIQLADISTITINARDIVSENGIPHKIDVVLTSDGTNRYCHLYIDGVDKYVKSVATAHTVNSQLQSRFNIISLATTTSDTVSDTDWYITNIDDTQTSFITTALTEVNAGLVSSPNHTSATVSSSYNSVDYITGVTSAVDYKLKTALETKDAGDKTITLTEREYKNPASIFDTTISNPTVKLVSKTTGDEVDVSSATVTMENYILKVNGIYVDVNYVSDTTILYTSDEDGFMSPSNSYAALTTGNGINLKSQDITVGKYTPDSTKTNFLFKHSDIDVSSDYGKYFVYELSLYLDATNGGTFDNMRLGSSGSNAILGDCHFKPAFGEYNKWTRIQFVVGLDETNPIVEMWIDGKKVATDTPTAAFGNQPYIRFAESSGNLPIIYMDDVKVYTTLTKPNFSITTLGNTDNYTIDADNKTVVAYNDTIENIKATISNSEYTIVKIYRTIDEQLTEVTEGNIAIGDIIGMVKETNDNIYFEYYSVTDINYIKESDGTYSTSVQGILVGELIKLTTGNTSVTPVLSNDTVKIKAFVFDSLVSAIPQCKHLEVLLTSK